MKKFFLLLIQAFCLISLTLKGQNFSWQTVDNGIPSGNPKVAKNINGRLFIGGHFASAGGASANNFAILDGDHFIPPGTGIDCPSSGSVIDFAYCRANKKVYALTDFVPYIWQFDSTTEIWSTVSNLVVDTAIVAMVATKNDSSFLFTGPVTKANTTSCHYAFKWNALTGTVTTLGNNEPNWTEGLPGVGQNLVSFLGNYYFIYFYPSLAAPHIQKLNDSTELWESINLPSAEWAAWPLIIWANDTMLLYSYVSIDQNGVASSNVALFNGNQWKVLGQFPNAPPFALGSDVKGNAVVSSVFNQSQGDSINTSPTTLAGYDEADSSWFIGYGAGPGLANCIIDYNSKLYAFGSSVVDQNGVQIGIACWSTAVTGVNPVAQTNIDFNAYPNPSQGQLTLIAPIGAKVQIFDALGRSCISQQLITEEKTTLSLHEAPGIYTLELLASNQTYSKKIVIQY